MSKWKRIIIGVFLFSLIAVFIAAFVFLRSDFYIDDEAYLLELNDQDPDVLLKYFDSGDLGAIRYIRQEGNQGKPILLTIHGAPGSGADFLSYWSIKELIDRYDLITIDRPGYGPNYDFDKDVAIVDQAIMISKMLHELAPNQEVSILSHSYGGPIGAVLAGLLDSLCLGHVMVAPVIDPDSEEVFWFSALPLKWPFYMFASNCWKMAAHEKVGHVEQLKKLADTYQHVKSPTIHIHGTDDWLASINNVGFCEEHFEESYYTSIIIDEGSHFILWEGSVQKKITQALQSLLVGE